MALSASGAPRVGVFGGAFDPPHRAHVALVEAGLAQLGLAALHVLPTGDAWHKPRGLSAAGHRLAMTRLAFGTLPGVVVDDREIRRGGPTYTVDTLRELQAEHPGAELCLIIGADQAGALQRWHAFRDVLALAIICIADRDESATAFGELPSASASAGLDPEVQALGRFERLQLPRMDVSATDIRSRVASGHGIAPLVPPPVARYIAQHHLYLTA